jgi:hypothetical protein
MAKEIEFPNNNLTNEDKQDITALIRESIAQMGTASAVASMVGISDTTISLIAQDKYNTQGDDMWRKIGVKLGWNKSAWVVVEDVTNTRMMLQTLSDAHQKSMFIGVAERAGAGKSSGIDKYREKAKAGNVFYLECWTWGPKEFLAKLRAVIGQPKPSGANTVNEMLESVIHYFEMRKGKPLLILDQANSLPHATLSLIIHIYNKLKNRIGCVLCGTENLKQKIERGVKNQHQGYDELDDRFGRSYVTLPGYLLSDVKKICGANGIRSEQTQKQIWQECAHVGKVVEGQNIKVTESGRVLERKIMKYLMLNKLEAQTETV